MPDAVPDLVLAELRSRVAQLEQGRGHAIERTQIYALMSAFSADGKVILPHSSRVSKSADCAWRWGQRRTEVDHTLIRGFSPPDLVRLGLASL